MSDKSKRAAASCVVRVAFQIAAEAAPHWRHRPEYIRRAYYDRKSRAIVHQHAFESSIDPGGEGAGFQYAAESALAATRALSMLQSTTGNVSQSSVSYAVIAAKYAAVAIVPGYGRE